MTRASDIDEATLAAEGSLALYRIALTDIARLTDERDAARAVVAELVAALRYRRWGIRPNECYCAKAPTPCAAGVPHDEYCTSTRAALARAAALLDGKGEG